MTPDAKKAAVAGATNPELCKITEELVFTHPYDDSPTNAYPPGLPRGAIDRLQRHPPLRAAVGEMKYAFMTATEARLHGDLHTGSVMANAEETFVMDPEFSFYGPMGFDVGAYIANLFLAYVALASFLPIAIWNGIRRWEIVLVVGPAPETTPGIEAPLRALRRLVDAGAKPRPAAGVVAELTGVSANALYRALTETPADA